MDMILKISLLNKYGKNTLTSRFLSVASRMFPACSAAVTCCHSRRDSSGRWLSIGRTYFGTIPSSFTLIVHFLPDCLKDEQEFEWYTHSEIKQKFIWQKL